MDNLEVIIGLAEGERLLAALRATKEAVRYHNACVAAAGQENLNLERAARLLIALAGEVASPVTVRLNLSED